MPWSAPGWHSSNRWFEWVMAGIFVAQGVYVAILPESLMQSRMSPILDVIGIEVYCAMYIAIGLIRGVGLFFVGRLRGYEFHMRAVGAVICMINWAWLSLALRLTAQETSMVTSQAVMVYLGLAVGEAYSIYRALADGKRTCSRS